jgi:inner membrane protein
MPTVMTHAVVGVTIGTLMPFAAHRRSFWVASALLPMLPDLDVVGLAFGIPFRSLWGHRGMTHSLATALVIGAVAAALLHRHLRVPALPLTLYFALITASHGVFDALTNGGTGVAFFAPLDATRYFFGWRPLPVSPLGARFFSAWGWYVFRTEMVLIWIPAALVAAIAILARRQRGRRALGGR